MTRTRTADPLADDAPPVPCDCGRATCRCPKCHGARWVHVTAAYALHTVPDPTAEQMAMCDSHAEVAAVWADLLTRRAAMANSVYPCRECSPGAFYRWAGGHFAPNHDVADCDECIETLGGKRAALRAARAHQAPPERKDTGG